jgi:hypothetical protein
VRHVTPKTLDYIEILSGISTGAAVDVRVPRLIQAAGVEDLSYRHTAAVVPAAAAGRAWRAGDADAALWQLEPIAPSACRWHGRDKRRPITRRSEKNPP